MTQNEVPVRRRTRAVRTVADLTPQEALEQFERTTGFRIHAATDAGGVVWWRQPSEQPMFECTIGDRCMHIDELATPATGGTAPYEPAREMVHGLSKGGESWCGGHHVRASLKRETVTCPDCLTAMDSGPRSATSSAVGRG